jgi:nucleoside-diphosphate-sugar epimerase
VSTFVVWGKPAQIPFDEETPVGPERFTAYAESKYEGDLVIWKLYRERGLPVVVLYPGGVMGAGNPKANGQYIQDLVKGRMPGMVFEDSTLTWVHVKDVAEAIVRALEKEGNKGEEYLVGKHALAMGELTRTVCEISGAPLPKVSIPDPVIMAGATLLTKVADLTGRPPLLGMSKDTMMNLKEGAIFDGSKAERELSVTYTPIREALEEEVASHR